MLGARRVDPGQQPGRGALQPELGAHRGDPGDVAGRSSASRVDHDTRLPTSRPGRPRMLAASSPAPWSEVHTTRSASSSCAASTVPGVICSVNIRNGKAGGPRSRASSHAGLQLRPQVAPGAHVDHLEPRIGGDAAHAPGGREARRVARRRGRPDERDDRHHQPVAGRGGEQDLHTSTMASGPAGWSSRSQVPGRRSGSRPRITGRKKRDEGMLGGSSPRPAALTLPLSGSLNSPPACPPSVMSSSGHRLRIGTVERRAVLTSGENLLRLLTIGGSQPDSAPGAGRRQVGRLLHARCCARVETAGPGPRAVVRRSRGPRETRRPSDRRTRVHV